jgi:hypothetical protein
MALQPSRFLQLSGMRIPGSESRRLKVRRSPSGGQYCKRKEFPPPAELVRLRRNLSASGGKGEGEALNFLVPSFLAKSTERSEGLVRLWRNFAQKFFIQEIP